MLLLFLFLKTFVFINFVLVWNVFVPKEFEKVTMFSILDPLSFYIMQIQFQIL